MVYKAFLNGLQDFAEWPISLSAYRCSAYKAIMIEEKEEGQSKCCQRYRMVKALGKGCQAEVFQVEDICSLQRFALKVIETGGMQARQIERVQFQVKSNLYLSRQLQSTYFPKLFSTFQKNHSIQILFELCDENAESAFKRLPSYSARYNFILVMLHDLLHALRELQTLDIIHRDIKPENILLKAGHFKLGDLGLSRAASRDTFLTNDVGNRLGRSPEFITGKYTLKADIWSLGIHSFYLFESTLPFDARSLARIKNNPNEIEKVISSDELEIDLQVGGRRSRKVLSFIHLLLSDMIVIDPLRRSAASQLIESYFAPGLLQQGEVIRGLLLSYLAQRELYGEFYLALLLAHHQFYRIDSRVRDEAHPNKKYICLKVQNTICQSVRWLVGQCSRLISSNEGLAKTIKWVVEQWQQELGVNLQSAGGLWDIDEVLELYKIGKVREKFPLLEWLVKLCKIGCMRGQGLQPPRLQLWHIPLDLYKMI